MHNSSFPAAKLYLLSKSVQEIISLLGKKGKYSPSDITCQDHISTSKHKNTIFWQFVSEKDMHFHIANVISWITVLYKVNITEILLQHTYCLKSFFKFNLLKKLNPLICNQKKENKGIL